MSSSLQVSFATHTDCNIWLSPSQNLNTIVILVKNRYGRELKSLWREYGPKIGKKWVCVARTVGHILGCAPLVDSTVFNPNIRCWMQGANSEWQNDSESFHEAKYLSHKAHMVEHAKLL